jgi:hypothetical protein
VGPGAFKRKESVALVNDFFSAVGLLENSVGGYAYDVSLLTITWPTRTGRLGELIFGPLENQ